MLAHPETKLYIHYFSGTGNTFHASNCLARALEKLGYDVTVINIEKTESAPAIIEGTLHIFAFPLYGFGMPALFLKYIKSLSRINRCKAALLSIGGHTGKTGGYEGQALSHGARVLRRKGFRVMFTEMVSYPENWTQLFNPPEEKLQDDIVTEADIEMERIAHQIADGHVSYRRTGFAGFLLTKLIYWIFSLLGRRILGLVFIADKKCNSCGKCARICPVVNIKMKRGKPVWGLRCEACQRCMNACPTKSIQTSILRLSIQIVVLFIPFLWLKLLKGYVPINYLTGTAIYVASYLFLILAANQFIGLLERNPAFRKLSSYSFTARYRRYLSKDAKF